MATRIRDRWRNPGKQNSIEDSATALAYICWQLALTSARNLHAEDFFYQDDRQRVAVIQEYLIFLNHVSDRLAFDRLSEAERPIFVSTLAHSSAAQLQRNASEVLGAGDYRASFIDVLNQRNTDYGQCAFSNGAAGYSLLRTFGDRVKVIMGDDQTNRWVIDQVMDVDGPQLVQKLKKSLSSLLNDKGASSPSGSGKRD